MLTLDAFGNPIVGGPDIAGAYTVENTAQLRLFTVEPPAGTLILTLGDVAQGDGDGGFWYWVPNSTLPDDGINVVKCTAIFAGRFYSVGISGVGLNQLTGDVTAGPGAGSQAATIAAAAVTTAKIADSNVTAVKLATDSVTTAKVQDAAVTLAKMANLAANRYIGSIAGGVPSALTMTAAGRVVMSSADDVAIRSYLNIPDIGDLRNYALSRAQTLLGLIRPTTVVDESFLNAPTVSPCFFTGAAGTGTNSQRTDRSGGWVTVASASSAGTDRNIHNSGMAAGGGTGCVVHNVGTSKWYQLWLFSIDTTVDSSSLMEMGWINTAFSVNNPKVGVIGSGSTTKFRAFDNSTGVNSSVNIDTGIHIVEHWCDGATNIYMSVDGETPVTYVTAKTNAVMPIVQVSNGGTAAVKSVSIGHCIIITPQS